MNIEEKFNLLVKEAKKIIFLKKEEKESVRLNLIAFMHENPAINSKPTHDGYQYLANWASLFRSKRIVLRYVLAMSCTVLLLGVSGISFAANGSLPGDLLYPVKVGVNEKVLSFLLLSGEAKAKYDVHLAKLRLEEGEKAAVGKKLNDQTRSKIESLFNEHIDNAKKHLSGAKDHAELSAKINSDLEASLNAHAQILNQLVNRDGDNNAKNVQSILSEVQTKTDAAKRARQDSEDALSLQPSSSVKSPAEDNLAKAEKKLDEVNNFIESKKSSMNQNSYDAANKKLMLAKSKISQGKDELTLGNYGKAFSTSQEAMRIGQETKIRLRSSIDLKIELPKMKGGDKNK